MVALGHAWDPSYLPRLRTQMGTDRLPGTWGGEETVLGLGLCLDGSVLVSGLYSSTTTSLTYVMKEIN